MAAQDSLKVAAIFGRTASGSATGVPDLDQEEIRLATTGLLGPGYLPSMIDQTANPSAFNVRQDTGSNLQLKIGSGTSKKDAYVILGPGGQGAYVVRLDATTKTITVPAADATNPARYGVYLFIDDTAYSGTASRAYAQVACIRGTPAGSPTTPGPLATYSAYTLLWEFQLAANATAVTNTILDNTSISTDRRHPSPVLTQFVGCKLRRAANLSLATTVATDVPWDTEDFDPWGFITPTTATLTVPTGMGGMYLIAYSPTPVATSLTSRGDVLLSINGTTTRYAIAGGTSSVSVPVTFGPLPLAAGDTFKITETQSSGSSKNIIASLIVQRISSS